MRTFQINHFKRDGSRQKSHQNYQSYVKAYKLTSIEHTSFERFAFSTENVICLFFHFFAVCHLFSRQYKLIYRTVSNSFGNQWIGLELFAINFAQIRLFIAYTSTFAYFWAFKLSENDGKNRFSHSKHTYTMYAKMSYTKQNRMRNYDNTRVRMWNEVKFCAFILHKITGDFVLRSSVKLVCAFQSVCCVQRVNLTLNNMKPG